ncbi:hypothetical protein [Halorussus marinus]|uniref:hypothetical protein n=1 Tax=Halorussus marinus TaxID=2505976 RepID=UPI00109295CC|nr:hypothetical protein [Halorussus marinus]
MADNRPDAGSGESRRLAPSWTVALVALSPAFDLYEAGRVSLVWFGIGVVSWAAATGPVAASRFGRRVGAWFRGIGALGRAIVILGVAGAWTGVVVTFEPPAVPIDSFVLGGSAGE